MDIAQQSHEEFKFSGERAVEGTLDYLAGLQDGPQNTLQRLCRARREITTQAVSELGCLQFELYDRCKHFKAGLYTLATVLYSSEGYVQNACDSVVLKAARSPTDYIARVQIRISAGGGVFRFETEDNGTGINPRIKDKLFASEFTTKRRKITLAGEKLCIKHVTNGESGVHLKRIKEDIENLGGSYGLVDKGPGVGALFWYEVPLSSLERRWL